MLLVKRDIDKDNVIIRWLPTDHMLVDGLTKQGVNLDFLRKVLSEGRVTLKEDDTILRWIGKAQKHR